MSRANPRPPFRRYGNEPPTEENYYVTAMLRPDAAAAVFAVMREHGLSKSGAVHHLVRLGAGLSPLPPLDTTTTHGR